MSIYLSIIAAAGNEVQQSQVGASLTKSLTISEIHDTDSGALNVADFNYEWYFVDKPTGSSVSIDDSSSPANKSTVLINSIDTWGTYRIFVIATNIAIPSTKSGTNPLSADERNFVNISVKSTNNSLEKPAAFQRNWKEKYDKLVDVVDNTQKSINSIKISNSLTLTLPSTDGTSGQILITDGQGNLSFNSVSAAELSNVSLESLTNVSSTSPTSGQVLSWDSSISSWKPETLGSFSFNLVDDTTPQLGGNLDCQAFNLTTTGKILFSNVYATEADLPSAATYHGMFAHVHATGKAYFAHGGSWIKLVAESASTTDNLSEGSSNLYYTNARADARIGAANLNSLSNVYSSIAPTDGQVLKWDDSESRWDAGDDNSGGSSLSGLSSSNSILTIANNYSLVPENTANVELGSDSNRFLKLWIGSGSAFDVGIKCDNTINTNRLEVNDSVTTNSIIIGSADPYILPVDGGSENNNKYLKFSYDSVDGSSVEYSNITASEISDLGTSATLNVGTSANNIVQLDSTGKLPAIDGSLLTGISGGGSAADNISEGNSKVETVDTGSDGSVNFYTEVSSDSSVFSSIPTPVWKIDESGNLTPGKTDTFNLGFYDSMGNASDNRQINKIHVNKVYTNGNYFRIPPAMSSSDFKLNAVHDAMSQTYDIPFYDSSTSPSSTTGHILVKNLNESVGPHNWIPWKLKLPSSFSYNSNSVMVSNSAVDELAWEKTDLYKTKEWSNMHSDEWTTETTYASSYTAGVVGKSIFIFAFKNITGKTINITKASLSCLEMYSSKIYWTLVGASDTNFKTNKGTSLISEQTISIVNQDSSSPYSGIGQSEANLSETISDGLWTAFLITNMTSGSSSNKNFVANLTYTLS
jgi:hypothetical protein